MELDPARRRSSSLAMAPVNKVHHVHTLSRAAEIFGEDEDWLLEIACEMDAEDGLIRIYGPGGCSASAPMRQNWAN